ncbi:MAG: sterol desaturase family protein [Bacteroidetes bacterium]|nr:sterol desaturase family protein [Bacteroidota bacterium]
MEAKKLFVSIKDESVRMFDNKILDLLSRVHWTVPLIFWTPVVIACVYFALFGEQSINFLSFIIYFGIGLLIWTFSEYILHRFVFHYHPTTEFGKRINFITHGVHHDYPNDSLRLVMPPALSVPLSLPFMALFYYLFGGLTGATFAAFSGLVIGYLSYDMMHYALHYAKWNNPYFVKLKHHHMFHHYKDPDNGYGVSSKLWDVVFGTRFSKDTKIESDTKN